MQYLISLSDASKEHLVVFTLDRETVSRPAIDFVFEVVGADDVERLAHEGKLSEDMSEDLMELQKRIFDRDGSGTFIRRSVYFTVDGRELDPDAPLLSAFAHQSSEQESHFQRLELMVHDSDKIDESDKEAIKDLAPVLFLHQLAVGSLIDVTKDYPDLVDLIARLEKESLIEIDVEKASYKLTPSGKRVHESYMSEAQELIRKYDVYADVEVNSQGVIRFDTGLGVDLRVPVWEAAGVDPFRARFLLGLNDGEWDQMVNWWQAVEDPRWYGRIFEPVEKAPSVQDIGSEELQEIIEQGKNFVRSDPRL